MAHTRTAEFTRQLLIVALVVAGALFLWAVHNAVLLGFAAILLAVAVHGIADGLEKAKLSRSVALGLAGVLFVGALVGVVVLFGAQLAAELSDVVARLPEAWTRAKETLSGSQPGQWLVAEIDRIVSGDGGAQLQDMLARAGSYTLPLASGVTTALLVIFTAAFLTVDAGAYRRGLLLLAPRGVDDRLGVALDDSARALKKWLLGILFDIVVIAVLLGAALWALGVPAFMGLALIAGLAQFVPTIGPLAAAIPGVLLAFTVSPTTALWTAIAYLVISQLEANVLYPIVQKKTASIPPALNLLAVLAFGMLFGPLGILLATPLLVVLQVFVVRLYVQDALGKDAEVPSA